MEQAVGLVKGRGPRRGWRKWGQEKWPNSREMWEVQSSARLMERSPLLVYSSFFGIGS